MRVSGDCVSGMLVVSLIDYTDMVDGCERSREEDEGR